MKYYGYTEEELTRLLYLMDTKELDIQLMNKPKETIEIEEKYYYKTDEDKETICNNYGCYAIVNEVLQIIYIGETITSFHQRWNGHYNNLEKDTKRKQTLLKHPDTYCTIIYISNGNKEETENIEAQTIKWYKENYPNWTILGGTYRDNCWYKGVTC